jgi:hypothetical protein
MIGWLQGYAPGSDPFAGGFLRLQQSGADTLVQIDRNGGSDGFTTLLTLKNVAAFALTSANLGGLAPPVSSATVQTAAPSGSTLVVGPGNAVLNGGAGIDTAQFSGLSRQYTIGVTAGSGTISGGSGGGLDSLSSIDQLQFVDGVLSTGTATAAAQVYRIYEATLGHAPDPDGLAYWTHLLGSGALSLQGVADAFVSSPEFQNTYGNVTDSAFVTLLYNNVLHRAPDPDGLSYWVGDLANGLSRSQVVLSFSEGGEDIANTAPAVQQGLWVQDTGAAEVARLYDAVLGRLPDASGETYWTHLLDSGALTLQQATEAFVATPEFTSVYGALDNTAFVNQLYENTLHRAPDPAGAAYWVGDLAAGLSRAVIVESFSEGAEHVANTAAHINQGVWLA